MHVLKRVLESHGLAVTVVQETHVGYVVYEDEAQVVAEPFADTRTGPTRRSGAERIEFGEIPLRVSCAIEEVAVEGERRRKR